MRQLLLIALLPTTAIPVPAQDTGVLSEAMDNFKGAANEVRKNNPVLAIGTGEGITSLVKGLSGRPKGKGPVRIELPAEQQKELERRQKAKERAAANAKQPPGGKASRAAAVAAGPPPSGPSIVPAITPLMLMVILNPLPTKPKLALVTEEALARLSAGQSRSTILAALGKPQTRSAVNGLENGSWEELTYYLDEDHAVVLRLEGGNLTRVQRP
jgi:hypothetical protein